MTLSILLQIKIFLLIIIENSKLYSSSFNSFKNSNKTLSNFPYDEAGICGSESERIHDGNASFVGPIDCLSKEVQLFTDLQISKIYKSNEKRSFYIL